jgi:hypothetical protein
MKYKLTHDNWKDLDSKFDAKAGRSLVRSDRICYWKESIMQECELPHPKGRGFLFHRYLVIDQSLLIDHTGDLHRH